MALKTCLPQRNMTSSASNVRLRISYAVLYVVIIAMLVLPRTINCDAKPGAAVASQRKLYRTNDATPLQVPHRTSHDAADPCKAGKHSTGVQYILEDGHL